jgi:hypothetical protein
MPTTPVDPADVRIGDTVTIVAKIISLWGPENAIAAGPEGRDLIVALDRVTDGVTFTREQPGRPEWPGPGKIGWARLKGRPDEVRPGYTSESSRGPVFCTATGVTHFWDLSVIEWIQAVRDAQ